MLIARTHQTAKNSSKLSLALEAHAIALRVSMVVLRTLVHGDRSHSSMWRTATLPPARRPTPPPLPSQRRSPCIAASRPRPRRIQTTLCFIQTA